MPKRMSPPFPTYEAKPCENPDCKQGEAGGRQTFIPKTPWQRACCAKCRNRLDYLERKKRTGPEFLDKGGRV